MISRGASDKVNKLLNFKRVFRKSCSDWPQMKAIKIAEIVTRIIMMQFVLRDSEPKIQPKNDSLGFFLFSQELR